HVRYGEKYRYEFYLNTSGQPAELNELCGTDLLSGRELSGTAELETNGVLILKNSLPKEER
ncbi:MAG: Beta-galactosidase C-terminal domain, partial [Oscillospiraceae bacterium]|nr:Beta-galactosidase C-terminal domain [Oscillospiraceae bacterium]